MSGDYHIRRLNNRCGSQDESVYGHWLLIVGGIASLVIRQTLPSSRSMSSVRLKAPPINTAVFRSQARLFCSMDKYPYCTPGEDLGLLIWTFGQFCKTQGCLRCDQTASATRVNHYEVLELKPSIYLSRALTMALPVLPLSRIELIYFRDN